MSYYAHGGGQLVLKDGVKAPADVWKLLCQDFSEVADAPDGGIYLTFEQNKYHDDEVRESMSKLAPFVKSGNVEFTGEDGEEWRFRFWSGNVRYEVGRTVYEPEDRDELHSERMELLSVLAEAVEDWLESKGITADDIPCEDRDQAIEDGEDPDGLSMIYGEDYDDLTGRFEEALINCELLKEEN